MQRDPNYWSPQAVAERWHVGERVAAILRLARGDPRLSAWEEGIPVATDPKVRLSKRIAELMRSLGLQKS